MNFVDVSVADGVLILADGQKLNDCSMPVDACD